LQAENPIKNAGDTARSQYLQIDILSVLGKIGFECISAHAERFLKAVGRKSPGEGSRFSGRIAPFRFERRLTGQHALPIPCSLCCSAAKNPFRQIAKDT
jgi:hypothetical protein